MNNKIEFIHNASWRYSIAWTYDIPAKTVNCWATFRGKHDKFNRKKAREVLYSRMKLEHPMYSFKMIATDPNYDVPRRDLINYEIGEFIVANIVKIPHVPNFIKKMWA